MFKRKTPGRLTHREKVESVNRGLRHWGAMFGKPEVAEKLVTHLPPKRDRVKRPVDGRPAVPLESAVNDDIYDAFKHHPAVKLYRNNRGVAQYGNQLVRYGVGPKGGADWIGYVSVVITPEMVGTKIAQFAAVEAKRPGEKADENQQTFIDGVKAAGGKAGVATSAAEAKAILE